MIPAFDRSTGALPPGNYPATLEEMIRKRFGFTPRRRWLLKGIRAAVEAFWAAGIREIYIDGSFCTEKPDPGDVDGYWVEPDEGVYDRIDPTGSTSTSFWFRSCGSGSGECGPTMGLSSSFIRRCRPARKWASRSSFDRTAMGNLAA